MYASITTLDAQERQLDPKIRKKTMITNYRPIAIGPHLSKAMGKSKILFNICSNIRSTVLQHGITCTRKSFLKELDGVLQRHIQIFSLRFQ